MGMLNPEQKMAKRGRPRIDARGNLQLFNVKLPVWVIEQIRDNAAARGKKPGTVAREALTYWAMQTRWEPKGGE